MAESVDKPYIEVVRKIVLKMLEGTDGKVYFFGSRARGDASRISDIDIAIDPGQQVTRYMIALISEELEEASIPYEVDVVNMNACSKGLRDEILREGIVWRS